MSKHTIGPWTYIDATQSAAHWYRPVCVIKAGNKEIASFSWNDNSQWFPNKEESQANARLIAAAPDMYNALKDVMDFWSSSTDDDMPAELFDRANSAIAKAVQP